jgi:hypothetical protein
MIAPAVPATAAGRAAGPWGPVHRIAAEVVKRQPAQVVTTDGGTSAVTWLARRAHRSFEVHAAVRSRSGHWSQPTRVSSPGERAVDLHLVAWGSDNVSVFWQREVSTDDWQFRMRTLADGRWQSVRSLITARYAFPSFQVDVNDVGTILLSWEGGDHHVHSAVLGTDGPWRHLRSLAMRTPGATYRFVSNPQAAFLTADNGVRIIAWARRRGTSSSALWSARLAATRQGTSHKWRYARIGPTDGDRLRYGWVGQARFAADPEGDVAVVWAQHDPTTHRWTTLIRYDPVGPGIGSARVLGHARCDPGWTSCGDVAMSDSGDALVAWALPSPTGPQVMVARRPRHGRLSSAQTLYTETVKYAFSGVDVNANAHGDAVVRFLGGGAQVLLQEFARCPAGRACGPLVQRRDRPSWLDQLGISVAPKGGALIAWATGCGGGGEACFFTDVWARRLAASL